MTDEERKARDRLGFWGRSMFERGLSPGSSGNLSVRLGATVLVTPTGSCLGTLAPESLSLIEMDGRHLSGDRPTKEAGLHLAVYRARPGARAIVHLHAPYSTALSCLSDLDPANAIEPITPYAHMRLGAVPLVPYHAPGSADLAAAVGAAAGARRALLLANHGLVVAGDTLEAAVFDAEEFEATARLLILTRGMPTRRLTADELATLDRPRG